VQKERIETILQQTTLQSKKIGGDVTIFVLNKGTKAQHSKPM
jgi:hypothetical protein